MEENQLAIDNVYIGHSEIEETGSSPRSIRAVSNLAEICSKYLDGDYELQIVDIYEKPELAGGIKLLPFPLLSGSCLPRKKEL
jgi:circadian clock protein KaiB